MTLLDDRQDLDADHAVAQRALRAVLDVLGPDVVTAPGEIEEWLARQPDPEIALGHFLRTAATAEARPGGRIEAGPAVPPASVAAGPAPIPGLADRWRGFFRPDVAPVTDPAWLSAERRRRARVGLWARNAGVVILLFLLYQWFGTGFEQRRAQSHLRAQYNANTIATSALGGSDGAAVAASGGVRAATTKASPPAPLPGGVVARLQIPAIHLDQFVVEGTGDSELKKGPGHYIGSPFPGQHGNSAIAGHRTTYGAPFNRLPSLKPGDTIIASTAAGRFLYVVASQTSVSPNQSSVIEDYGDDRLTLTTCTPEFLATQRFVVVAKLEGPAPAAPAPRVAPPARLASVPTTHGGSAVQHLGDNTANDWHWAGLPTSLLGVLVLSALGLLYRPMRRHFPPFVTVVLLAPVWAAFLLLFFQHLNGLLPANV